MVLPGSAAEGHGKPEQLLIASLVSCPRPERQGPPRGERNGPGLPGPAAVTAAETPRRRAKLIGVLAPRGCSLFCAEVCGYEGRFPHYSPAASPSAAASPPQRAHPPQVSPLSSGPVTPRGSPPAPDNSKRGQKRRARPGLPRGRAAGGRLQLTVPAIPQPGPRPAAPYLPLSAALLLWPRGWVNPGRRFLRGPFRQRRRASGPSSGLGGERRPSSRPAAIFPWRRGGGALPPPSWMRPHVCRTSRPIVCRTAGAILVVADERQRSAPPSSYGTGT